MIYTIYMFDKHIFLTFSEEKSQEKQKANKEKIVTKKLEVCVFIYLYDYIIVD